MFLPGRADALARLKQFTIYSKYIQTHISRIVPPVYSGGYHDFHNEKESENSFVQSGTSNQTTGSSDWLSII